MSAKGPGADAGGTHPTTHELAKDAGDKAVATDPRLYVQVDKVPTDQNIFRITKEMLKEWAETASAHIAKTYIK